MPVPAVGDPGMPQRALRHLQLARRALERQPTHRVVREHRRRQGHRSVHPGELTGQYTEVRGTSQYTEVRGTG